MVTITFDLAALIISFGIGILIGGIIVCVVERRKGGPWSNGWAAGYKTGKLIGKMSDHVTVISCYVTADEAREPYCEQCGAKMDKEE